MVKKRRRHTSACRCICLPSPPYSQNVIYNIAKLRFQTKGFYFVVGVELQSYLTRGLFSNTN